MTLSPTTGTIRAAQDQQGTKQTTGDPDSLPLLADLLDFVWLRSDGPSRSPVTDLVTLPPRCLVVAEFFAARGLSLGFLIATSEGLPYKIGIPYSLPDMLRNHDERIRFEASLDRALSDLALSTGFQAREQYYKPYVGLFGPTRQWIIVIDPVGEPGHAPLSQEAGFP
jgi:hypothetical protein